MNKENVPGYNVSPAKAYLMITRGQLPRVTLEDSYELRNYLRIGGYFEQPENTYAVKRFRYYVDHGSASTKARVTLHEYQIGFFAPIVSTHKG